MEIPSQFTMTAEMRAELKERRAVRRDTEKHKKLTDAVISAGGDIVHLPRGRGGNVTELRFDQLASRIRQSTSGAFRRNALGVLAVLRTRAIELAQLGLDLDAYRVARTRWLADPSICFDVHTVPTHTVAKLSDRLCAAVTELTERVELEKLRTDVDLSWRARRAARKAAAVQLVEHMALITAAFDELGDLAAAELTVAELTIARADADAEVEAAATN